MLRPDRRAVCCVKKEKLPAQVCEHTQTLFYFYLGEEVKYFEYFIFYHSILGRVCRNICTVAFHCSIFTYGDHHLRAEGVAG